MTLEEVLERLNSIGEAFDNDYNDGDGPDYEGFYVVDTGDDIFLFYNAQLENGKKVKAVFRMEDVSIDDN